MSLLFNLAVCLRLLGPAVGDESSRVPSTEVRTLRDARPGNLCPHPVALFLKLFFSKYFFFQTTPSRHLYTYIDFLYNSIFIILFYIFLSYHYDFFSVYHSRSVYFHLSNIQYDHLLHHIQMIFHLYLSYISHLHK